jgi:hypothetical protein
MFKFIARNPESPLSVLAAGFRLYFASFLYSLTLTVVASLTFLSSNFITYHFLPANSFFIELFPAISSSILSFIFFIPLIKRIYSVAAGLPVTTASAFSGFFTHFIRLTGMFLLVTGLTSIIPVLWILYLPAITTTTAMMITIGVLGFVYVYIALKIYFTAIIIILENRGIIEALKTSFKLEHDHMLLTFSIIVIYLFGYWGVNSTLSGLYMWEAIGVDLSTLILSIISLPLFLSIQICQYFNLKKLPK